jgi:glycosyltransferase involved in cell wall biosynthesis
MISIFTPSFADEDDTNAQNLSVKEIVARLDPDRVRVTMLHQKAIDERIASRPNTALLRWHRHGNTARILLQVLRNRPDLYFFPREGPLDSAFLKSRKFFGLTTALLSYVVSGGLESGSYVPSRERHIREADAVVANNTYLAQLLREKMGISVSAVIHDGVDRRYFYPARDRQQQSKITVLYAGSLRPMKRVPIVIREAARFPEVRFCIAGAGEEENKCKSLAAELGCRNVEFFGHLSQSQVGDTMRKSDIFLFPSVLEGHPQVLLQAAASGLPIVAMSVYRPDCVVDGKTGFLAATDNELTKSLEELIRHPELRLAMGTAAIEHTRQFDWDLIARNWIHSFEQAIENRRGHSQLN